MKYGDWITIIDNDTYLYECPDCHKRVIGTPVGWYQYNYWYFCPYCGRQNQTFQCDLFEENPVISDSQPDCEYIL